MKRRSRDDLTVDQILGGGSVGGPEHDEILRRVLRGVPTEPPPSPAKAAAWPRRAVLLGAATALAGALALVLVVVRPWGPADRLVAKGPGGAGAGVVIEIACAGSGGAVCRVGDTLVFTVGGGAAGGFLGAYAERPDTAPTAVAGRIWYFPTASGASPRVDRQAGAATTALGRGIQIGAEHGAGRYRVVAWISSRPLARAEAREPPKPDGRLILQHASLDLTIVGGP